MAVPLSPQEVERKRVAIFKHESQKDRALFPGPDKREFWKRAQDRNRETAELYDRLGLAEYEAIEGFVRLESTNLARESQGKQHIRVDEKEEMKSGAFNKAKNANVT